MAEQLPGRLGRAAVGLHRPEHGGDLLRFFLRHDLVGLERRGAPAVDEQALEILAHAAVDRLAVELPQQGEPQPVVDVAIVEPLDRGEHGGGVVEAEARVRKPGRGRLRHARVGILGKRNDRRPFEPAGVEQGQHRREPHACPLVGEQAAEFVGGHEIAKRGPGRVVHEPVGLVGRRVDDGRHGRSIGHPRRGEQRREPHPQRGIGHRREHTRGQPAGVARAARHAEGEDPHGLDPIGLGGGGILRLDKLREQRIARGVAGRDPAERPEEPGLPRLAALPADRGGGEACNLAACGGRLGVACTSPPQ